MSEKGNKGTIHILFGFDETGFITHVRGILERLGYEVVVAQKYSKQAIQDFLLKNPEYKVAVLKEVMGRSRYSAEEFAELCDLRDINIIAVLGESHKGTQYMQTLYNAGITSAMFHSASKSEATPENVSRLIIEKRTREKARQVYGLSDQQMAFDVLTPEQIDDGIAAIQDESYGKTIGLRYLAVMSNFKTKQAFQFIQAMPKPLRNTLEKTDEFYIVLLKLQDRKVAINKKSWQEGMQRVLKQRKLEGKKKSVLELEEDANYAIKQEQEAVRHAKIKEEYAATGTYSVPEGLMESGDDFEKPENLNVASSYYAGGIQPPIQQPVMPPPVQQPVMQTPPVQQPVMQMPGGMEGQPAAFSASYQAMPPAGDWKAMKRWQKEQARLQKLAMRDMKRNARTGAIVKPEKQVKEPRRKRDRHAETSAMDIGREKVDMKPIVKRMVISMSILAVIAVIIVAVMASNKYSQENLQKQADENNVLVEQMNDLAELRGSITEIDYSNTVPRIEGLNNGESLMGIQVMDIINASSEMFYVLSLNGEIFTFSAGGATSNEVDVNSMYQVRLLTSGRFAFIQL